MLQIAVIGLCIGFIVLGVKGFTASGLALTKTKTLRGTPAKILGAICIAIGLGIIPGFILLAWAASN